VARGRTAAAISLLVAVLVAACDAGAPAGAGGDTYAAKDLRSERTVGVEDLRGRPALLTSWATWCTECREEMPGIERLWRDLGDDGLQVVTVNLDGAGPAQLRIDAMVEDWGLTMPQWRDEEGGFTVHFGGLGVPMSVLLDAEGRVVRTWQGAIDPASDEVRGQIEDLLAAGATSTSAAGDR
jgi:thiol-disulfide isomerase/thioredoxin